MTPQYSECQKCGQTKPRNIAPICKSCNGQIQAEKRHKFPMESRTAAKLICRDCEREKLRSEFYACDNRRSGASGVCKECIRTKQVRWEKKKPKEERKLYYRDKNLRTRFNLTWDERNKILQAQGGVCAGCKRPPADFRHTLAVDHDHSTHLIRGVLCWTCNSLMPRGIKVQERFKNLLSYLEKPPAITALGERYANPVKRRKRK